MVAFVILYYKAFSDTVECIESIKMLNGYDESIKIIVVDNGSNDGTFEDLSRLFFDEKNIDFIKTGANLGYAKGNNYGIEYAREKYNPDYLVILNSDAIIKQSDFCDVIKRAYNDEKYFILGPRVKGYNDDRDQSPILLQDDTHVYRQLVKNCLRWIGWKTYAIPLLIHKKNETITKKRLPDIRERNTCVCHGCCLVFSKRFLVKWKGFYPNTFLYREEVILFYIMHRLRCKTVFSDDVVVYHKGGASTNEEFKSKDERKKRLFTYKVGIKSLIEEIKVFRMNKKALQLCLGRERL